MVINTLVILGIFSATGFAMYRYMKLISGTSDLDSFDNDYTDVNTLTRKVQDQFAMMLRQDIREKNMTRRDYEQSQRTKAEIRQNLKEAAYGNPNAKKAIKAYITGMLLTEELAFGVNEQTIDEIIPFNNVDELHAQDKFEILNYIYSNFKQEIDKNGKECGPLGKAGFAQMFKDYMIDNEGNLIPTEVNGEMMFDFSAQKLDEIFGDIYPEYELDYTDKIAILAQRIFEKYKGFGVIDTLFDTNLDEIDAGVSGVSKDGYDIDSKNLTFSYQSIWITIFGNKVRLSCIGFESQEELIRVTQNIYKYGANKVLNKDNGYVVSTMKNGSRITVMRPPFASSYGFFARKFDSTPSVRPEYLIGSYNQITREYRYKNWELAYKLVKWLIRGERTCGVTGAQGTGKSTMLKSLISFISSTYSIRVQEISAELNLQYTYPNRNIVSFQETETIGSQAGINFGKKTNADITIIGELAEAVQATYVIQTAQVASLQALFTHHAKTAYDFITAIADNLLDPKHGIYSEKKEAVEKTAEILNIDIHLENQKGMRYLSRITEIIPTKATKYPTEVDENATANDDRREYYKRQTDRELFTCVNLVEFHNGEFILRNLPSAKMQADIRKRLSPEEEQLFIKDMEELKKFINNAA
ncbi:ATPase, T2SS/T4P/T4SS family [Butyrivibrio sp. AE2005]|uniref:ATPase, T2SS/T4P/T4SS family n=1 Tax=Butyrivibrio sp. AE2005 TaxID=1496722 RepID=UPI00047C7A51|nr:ATPase, T2SS/T4P/T4SS family [Butyrivibrio sp. AE2005]